MVCVSVGVKSVGDCWFIKERREFGWYICKVKSLNGTIPGLLVALYSPIFFKFALYFPLFSSICLYFLAFPIFSLNLPLCPIF